MRSMVSSWRVSQKIGPDVRPDLMIVPSGGSLVERLTTSTSASLVTALQNHGRFAFAPIVFSNSAVSEQNIQDFEFAHKIAMLRVDGTYRAIIVRPSYGFVDEAIKIHVAVSERGLESRDIVIVVGEILSPVAKIIYSRLFPDSRLHFLCVNYHCETQRSSPLWWRRGFARWFIGNLIMRLLLQFMPIKTLSKITF